MKNFNLSVVAVIISTLFLFNIHTLSGQEYTRDSLSMSPGYANDIYYSMANGVISEVARDNWDLAFYTARFSAGILINEGAGTNLYTYPNGDTSAWATVDTAGMDTWAPMYNSPYYWEDGAFNANQTGHPDYGWCVYNMVTHNLTGDSLYVVKFADNSIKKLWIVNKISVDNIYHFRYADLDGANEQEVELDVAPYEAKRFVYYSIQNNEVVDREPDALAWDLVFTKFVDLVPDNEGNLVPYPVTGAASNVDLGSNHYYPVADDYTGWSAEAFSVDKNAIGANWKYFDMNTFSFKIVDSTCYFVKDYAGDVYKLSFVYWQGSSTGNFALDKMVVSLSDVNNNPAVDNQLVVYPVPATDYLTVRMSHVKQDATVMVFDLNGRMLVNEKVSAAIVNAGWSTELNLRSGLYVVKVSADGQQHSSKLLVQ